MEHIRAERMGNLEKYRLYNVLNGSSDPPGDPCRTLPDGKVIYKLFKRDEVEQSEGMTPEEMRQYIKDNYPELNETEI